MPRRLRIWTFRADSALVLLHRMVSATLVGRVAVAVGTGAVQIRFARRSRSALRHVQQCAKSSALSAGMASVGARLGATAPVRLQVRTARRRCAGTSAVASSASGMPAPGRLVQVASRHPTGRLNTGHGASDGARLRIRLGVAWRAGVGGDGAGVSAVRRQPAWIAGRAGRMRRGRRGGAAASAGPGPDAAATILPPILELDPLPSASHALVTGLGDGGSAGGVDAAAGAVDAAAVAWGTAVSRSAGDLGDLVVDARVFGSEAGAYTRQLFGST